MDSAYRLALHAMKAIITLLQHAHRDGTCTAAHVHATDTNCRMRMPRLLNFLTTCASVTSCMHLKRYGRWLVAHTVALLLALPCNHTVAFAADISRWVRTQQLWDEKYGHLQHIHNNCATGTGIVLHPA